MVERAKVALAVGWQSGLTRRTRNAVNPKGFREFKSHPHRQGYRELSICPPEAEQMRYTRKGIGEPVPDRDPGFESSTHRKCEIKKTASIRPFF